MVWEYSVERCSKNLEPTAILCGYGGSVDYLVAIDHQIQGVGVLVGRGEIVFESFRRMQHLRLKSRYVLFVASSGRYAQSRYFTKSVLVTLREKLSLPCCAAGSVSSSGIRPTS